MIWTIILRFLKDPKILTIIGLVSMIVFMKFSIWSLENDIEKANILNSKLELKLDISKTNLGKVIHANDINEEAIEICIKNTNTLNGSYVDIIGNKDKVILRLRTTISELSTPVIYPETIVYKECKVKIKNQVNQGELDESDITFNSISNIGR